MDEQQRTDATDDEQLVRYASARDYLRVIRRRRLIIAVLTLLVGAGALVFSLNQEKRYEASASLSFRDPLADNGLISGGDSAPEDAPQTRAAINADLITSPAVVKRAARELDGDLSGAELAGSVRATVAAQTNLVVVTATAADPKLAADISNAFAVAAKESGDRQIRGRLADAEDVLKKRVKDARKDLGEGTTVFQLTSLTDQLSRVQTLQGIAQPVQITRQAGPPGAAVSPRPVRNTVLGLLAGLVIGLAVAFTRDALDRRFRTAHEVHQELGFAVLSRVPDSAMGYPGLAGAREMKDVMEEADFESFRVLRTNLSYLSGGSPLRSILVTSGLPEEGKSTVSMALASAAAVAGQRVLLVECDFRKPTFARRLGVEPKPGLADYLREEAEPAGIVQTVELNPPSGVNGSVPESAAPARMACIPAGSKAADSVELLDSDRFRGFLATVSRAYDLVVVDASPLLAVVDPLRVAPHVDAVLICVRVMRSTRDEARAVRSALDNLPKRPTGAVVTGLSRGGPDSYRYYYGY